MSRVRISGKARWLAVRASASMLLTAVVAAQAAHITRASAAPPAVPSHQW
jgi:hypothetical protein